MAGKDPATGKIRKSFPLEAAVLGENNMYTATGSKTGEWSFYTPTKSHGAQRTDAAERARKEKTITVYFKNMCAMADGTPAHLRPRRFP